MPIAYTEYGKNTNNKHVLFVHGLGASSLAWRDIPYALSNYFHTITVDLIGFGESDKPVEGDYTIKGFSKFIANFLKEKIKIGENEKISIVGHSLGGYIAAQFAIENRKMIEKLVLIDSSGLLERPTPLLEQYLDAAMEIEPVLRYKKLKRVLGAIYADPSFMPPVVIDKFVETIIKEGARDAFERAYENSTSTHIELQGFQQIQDVPCLVIWGEKDNLIPIEYYNKFKANLPEFPKSKAKYEIIKGTGHAPFVERTALVYEKLRKFLSEDK